MYRVSGYFLAPVLLLLILLFAYAVFELGGFLVQAWQRRHYRPRYLHALGHLADDSNPAPRGYPLLALALAHNNLSPDALDVAAMKELEGARVVSRIAPMLGLIATMIPMGPALKSLANGNVQGISENLIVAFSAVVFGLVIASVTFWIASFKKRWLAAELVDVTAALERQGDPSRAETELDT